MDTLLNEINNLLKELESQKTKYDHLVSRDCNLPDHLVKKHIEIHDKQIEMIGLKIQLLQLKVGIVSAKETLNILNPEVEAA